MPYLDFDRLGVLSPRLGQIAPAPAPTMEYIPERMPTAIAPPVPASTPGGVTSLGDAQYFPTRVSLGDLLAERTMAFDNWGNPLPDYEGAAFGSDAGAIQNLLSSIGYGNVFGEAEFDENVGTYAPRISQDILSDIANSGYTFGARLTPRGGSFIEMYDPAGNVVGSQRSSVDDNFVNSGGLALTAIAMMAGGALAGAGGGGGGAAVGAGEGVAAGTAAGTGATGSGITLGGVGGASQGGLYGLSGSFGAGGASGVGLAGTGSGLGLSGAGALGASLPSSAAIGAGLGAGIGSTLPAVGMSALSPSVLNMIAANSGLGSLGNIPPTPPGSSPSPADYSHEGGTYQPGGLDPVTNSPINSGGPASWWDTIRGYGGDLMDWAIAHPDQALQLGSLLGGAVGGGAGGGGGAAMPDQSGITALRPAAFNRQYVAPPPGYRPGFSPEHTYFTNGINNANFS